MANQFRPYLVYRDRCVALWDPRGGLPQCRGLWNPRRWANLPPSPLDFCYKPRHNYSDRIIGNYIGNLIKYTISMFFWFFALYGRWEALIVRKILVQDVGTISTPGKLNSEKHLFLTFSSKSSPWLVCAPQGLFFAHKWHPWILKGYNLTQKDA